MIKQLSDETFHTTMFYGNSVLPPLEAPPKRSFHTTMFYGNKGHTKKSEAWENFPHNYVLRKRSRRPLSCIGRTSLSFPHNYVLRKQTRAGVGLQGRYRLSTQLCSTETRARRHDKGPRHHDFPHNYVLRKLSSTVSLLLAEKSTFHTTMFYGNLAQCWQRMFTSGSPFHTTMFYGNDFNANIEEMVTFTFHTTMFYGNQPCSYPAVPSPSSFPHNYVLRKRKSGASHK